MDSSDRSEPPDATPEARWIHQLYDELRRSARRLFRAQPANHSLQPTALVHELYLRLSKNHTPEWESRQHFYAVASMAMRQILIDHARRRQRARRGGGMQKVTLSGLRDLGESADYDLIELDEVLRELSTLSPRQAEIVNMRVFGGMLVAEIAEVMAVSTRTIEKEWRRAKAWLGAQLRPSR